MPRVIASLFVLAVAFGVVAALHAQPQAVRAKLTIDDLVHIKHPSGHQWTPDGSHVYWTYDDGGVNNVWAAPADGSAPPVPLTKYADGQNANAGVWSKDGKTFYFQHGGGLQAVSVTGGTPQPAWPTAAHATGFSWSPDATRIAFVVTPDTGAAPAAGANETTPVPSDLLVHSFATSQDQKIAHADNRITGVSWSADGSTLTYTVGAGPGGGPIQHLSSPPEIGNKIIFVANEGGGRGGGTGGQTFTVSSVDGTPASAGAGGRAGRAGGAGRGGGGRGGGAQIDATHVLQTRTSNGGKTRTTESVDTATGTATVLHEETEDKFFSAVNTTASAISPNRKWLLFTADTTGWDQIYVMSTAGGPITQLTKTPGEQQ